MVERLSGQGAGAGPPPDCWTAAARPIPARRFSILLAASSSGSCANRRIWWAPMPRRTFLCRQRAAVFLPGTTHGGGRGGFSTAAPQPPNGCVLPANPNPEAETMRALTVDLIEWVTKGTEPPPSQYPRLDKGQLAAATKAALGFPNIPGVPSPDGVVNPVFDFDLGPDFNYNDESGLITKQPPTIKKTLPTLVPKVDRDGNDLGGVPSVLRQVPLGTYLGWNIVTAGFDKGKIYA